MPPSCKVINRDLQLYSADSSLLKMSENGLLKIQNGF